MVEHGFRGSAVVAAGLCGAILMVSHPVSAQGYSAEEESNRARVAASFDAWRAGTGSPYDLLAQDASWTIAGHSLAAKTYPSRADFIEEVIRPFNARMKSRLIPAVHRMFADGDTVIVHFDAAGTASDGRPYNNTYAWILEMKEGAIVRANAFFDSIVFDELWRRVSPHSSDEPLETR